MYLAVADSFFDQPKQSEGDLAALTYDKKLDFTRSATVGVTKSEAS